MRSRPGRRLISLVALSLAVGACHRHAAAPRDDNYHFASAGLPVALSATPAGPTLAWPAGLTAWDTALLGVRVHASGRAPHVQITAGGIRFDQYLDEGANGLRWLNLTGLRAAMHQGVSVSLSGVDVTIDTGTATLQAFDNRLDLSGPILVLSPHPDDAEIAAFGLYANRNAYIVTLTAGNAGDPLYDDLLKDPAEQYALKGYLRAIDSVTVPWQGGIQPDHAYNLGYFDARLQEMHDAPERALPEAYAPNTDVAPYRRANLSSLLPIESRQNSWNHLVEDLATLLKKIQPTVIVLPYPQMDEHRDHKFTAVALAQALASWPGSPRFLLYTNHAAGTGELYPYGPAGSAASVPPNDGSLRLMSVYAHPLDEKLRIRKLMALETMRDLRPSPSEQVSAVQGVANPSKRDSYPRDPHYDYLRRAPRPQEIFYLFDRPRFEATIADFLRPPGKQ